MSNAKVQEHTEEVIRPLEPPFRSLASHHGNTCAQGALPTRQDPEITHGLTHQLL